MDATTPIPETTEAATKELIRNYLQCCIPASWTHINLRLAHQTLRLANRLPATAEFGPSRKGSRSKAIDELVERYSVIEQLNPARLWRSFVGTDQIFAYLTSDPNDTEIYGSAIAHIEDADADGDE